MNPMKIILQPISVSGQEPNNNNNAEKALNEVQIIPNEGNDMDKEQE
jgi:hypothetical protein